MAEITRRLFLKLSGSATAIAYVARKPKPRPPPTTTTTTTTTLPATDDDLSGYEDVYDDRY